jgi:arsenate reductase
VQELPLVYFLCTGNACRSQMAEGWASALFGDRLQAKSAGVEPTALDPRATAAMAEAGVDISAQVAKAIDPLTLHQAALVITLCDDADQRCPLTPPEVRRLHWPLPDPASAEGGGGEALEAFRQVRDELKRKILTLPQLLELP